LNSRTLTIVVLVAVIAFMVYQFAIPSDDGDQVPPRTLMVNIKRVVNANKLKTDDGEYVLLAGVRAPFPAEPFGEEAIHAVDEMVLGKRIRMRFGDSQKDKDGRWVAFVFVDRQSVNEALVRQGYAYVRSKRGEERFEKELLAAQKEARSKRRGIWKNRSKDTEDYYIGDRKHGSVHRSSCEDVANIKPGDDVRFGALLKAYDNGFAPCNHCSPQE
jgi:endonuclease YncB( thermonuclease family)